MKRNIIISSIILFFILFFVLIKNFSSDPCDLLCDNCMGIEHCESCYEECYQNQ